MSEAKTESKCQNRQLEIDFYRRFHLDLGECQLVKLKVVNAETCELKGLCGKYLTEPEEFDKALKELREKRNAKG